MNWKSLVKAMQAEGYNGAEDDCTAVSQFVKGAGLVLKHDGKDVDIEQVFKAHQVREIELSNFDEKVNALESELAVVKSRARGAAAVHATIVEEQAPQRFSIGNSQRKSYDRKAKIGRETSGVRETAFASSDEAELFGAWVKSCLMPTVASKDDRDIVRKANITTTATLGGTTVPDIFVPALIDLKELRGAARKVLNVMTVGSDVVQMPRRTGGITVSWAGEGNAPSESNPTTNLVQVTANKMTALTYVSNELLNDSAIAFGDFVAREHAYGMADKEDEAVFNGDGTSTYGGHTGFRSKLLTDASPANNAGVIVGTGSASYSALTLTDFEAVVGRAPSYIDSESPVWVMHKEFYWNVAARLALASGGVTSTEVQNGVKVPLFLGYPVVYSQVMPRIAAASQICALFGAFNLAAKATQVGGGLQIASDTSVGFASDTTAFRGTNRFGITVHDVGNTSATPASRIPGPVCGLATGA